MSKNTLHRGLLALFVSFIVKKVLLGDSSIGTEAACVAAAVKVFLQHPPYPDIDREGVIPAKGKEQYAGGDLVPNPLYGLELRGAGCGVGEGFDVVEVKLPAKNPGSGVCQIPGAKADFQPAQRLFSGGGNGTGRRKGVLSHTPTMLLHTAADDPLAECGAERREYLFDSPYVVVLRYNKRTDRLPGVLPQNPDSPPQRERPGERGVMVGSFQTTGDIGSGVGPLAAYALVAVAGIRPTYAVAALALSLTIPLILYVRTRSAHTGQTMPRAR